jgi:hypothetical protein
MQISKCIGTLSFDGFSVNKSALVSRMGGQRFDEMIKGLTILTEQKVGQPKMAKGYDLREGKLFLPRSFALAFLRDDILDGLEVKYPEAVKIAIPPLQLNLYHNQILLINYVMETIFTAKKLAIGGATCIVNMKAGTGKTFFAAGLIQRLGLRTLFIVMRRPLVEQAIDCMNSGGLNDGPVFAQAFSKKCLTLAPVTVIVIDSALRRDTNFFAQFSFVIFDEIHAYCSPKRRRIFRMASARACLGMSATTNERLDGFDPIAIKEVTQESIIFANSLPGYEKDDDSMFQCHVLAVKYYGRPECTKTLTHETTGVIFTPYMNAQFLADEVRTAAVISELRTLCDWKGPNGEQHCIFVFCETRDPLEGIRAKFCQTFASEDVFAPELGTLMGGIKKEKVEEIRINARIILTTYAYSSVGLSIDKMTAMIFLTPRRNGMIQILARIMRKGGNPAIPRCVVDVIDSRTPICSQFNTRKLAYEYYNMRIKYKKICA